MGAISIFTVIESVLDRIWRGRANTRSGVLGWIKTRVLSFGIVLATAAFAALLLWLYYSA